MEGPRNVVLAGPRLAHDQHRHVARGEASELSEERRQRFSKRQREFARRCWSRLRLAPDGGPRDEIGERRRGDCSQVLGRSATQGGDRAVYRRPCGKDDHRAPGGDPTCSEYGLCRVAERRDADHIGVDGVDQGPTRVLDGRGDVVCPQLRFCMLFRRCILGDHSPRPDGGRPSRPHAGRRIRKIKCFRHNFPRFEHSRREAWVTLRPALSRWRPRPPALPRPNISPKWHEIP